MPARRRAMVLESAAPGQPNSARLDQGQPFECDAPMQLARGVLRLNTAHQIYRISQEAISNAIQHGLATRIDLRVARNGERLPLQVRDNAAAWGRTRPPTAWACTRCATAPS
jgi:signal transduction histidine kinase